MVPYSPVSSELPMVLLYYASQYFVHQSLKTSQVWPDFSLSLWDDSQAKRFQQQAYPKILDFPYLVSFFFPLVSLFLP